jgi:hypothetical protein
MYKDSPSLSSPILGTQGAQTELFRKNKALREKTEPQTTDSSNNLHRTTQRKAKKRSISIGVGFVGFLRKSVGYLSEGWKVPQKYASPPGSTQRQWAGLALKSQERPIWYGLMRIL